MRYRPTQESHIRIFSNCPNCHYLDNEIRIQRLSIARDAANPEHLTQLPPTDFALFERVHFLMTSGSPCYHTFVIQVTLNPVFEKSAFDTMLERKEFSGEHFLFTLEMLKLLTLCSLENPTARTQCRCLAACLAVLLSLSSVSGSISCSAFVRVCLRVRDPALDLGLG